VGSEAGRFTALGYGVIRPRRGDALPLRLVTIARELEEVIRRHDPTEASIEETFQGRDPKAALRLGEGRGAVLLVLARAGLGITGYANNVVKRAVTGAGRAEKDRVAAMVTRMLAIEEPPETFDATDALALALCHLQRGALAGVGAGGPSLRVQDAVRRAREADTRLKRKP